MIRRDEKMIGANLPTVLDIRMPRRIDPGSPVSGSPSDRRDPTFVSIPRLSGVAHFHAVWRQPLPSRLDIAQHATGVGVSGFSRNVSVVHWNASGTD